MCVSVHVIACRDWSHDRFLLSCGDHVTCLQAAAGFVSVLKELESFNNDTRQVCRKSRRRLPSPQSGKIILCPEELFPSLIKNQSLLVTNFRALYSKINQKNQGLSG